MSILLSIATFSFWQNVIDFIAVYNEFKSKEMIVYYKPIFSNISQLLIGICLLAYFKDISFLMSSFIFFFSINFINSIELNDQRTYGLGIIFGLSVLIIIWFIWHKSKNRMKITNTELDYAMIKKTSTNQAVDDNNQIQL